METAIPEANRPFVVGGTSEVFALGEGRILKLLHRRYPASKAELELELTNVIRSTGLPSPKAYDVLERDGRFGIVFERIDGISLLQLVERKPWKLFYCARLLAELHAQLHRSTAPNKLPPQRSQLENWLKNAHDFTAEERKAAEKSFGLVPGGNSICHGDFHPGNILLSSRGPVIIDWSTVTRGDAIVDVARTSVLFESAKLPPQSPWHTHLLLALARRLLHRSYLRRYLRLRPGSMAEIRRFLPIQRAATSAWRSNAPD